MSSGTLLTNAWREELSPPSAMRTIRPIILLISSLVAFWIVASLTDAIFNPANATFWTDSLVWSLLAGFSLAPAFLTIQYSSGSGTSRETSSSIRRKPFIEEAARPEPVREDRSREPSEDPSDEEWSYSQTGVVA